MWKYADQVETSLYEIETAHNLLCILDEHLDEESCGENKQLVAFCLINRMPMFSSLLKASISIIEQQCGNLKKTTGEMYQAGRKEKIA